MLPNSRSRSFALRGEQPRVVGVASTGCVPAQVGASVGQAVPERPIQMVQDTIDVLPADTLPGCKVSHADTTDPTQRPHPRVNKLWLTGEAAPPERCWLQPQGFRRFDGAITLIHTVPVGQD